MRKLREYASKKNKDLPIKITWNQVKFDMKWIILKLQKL